MNHFLYEYLTISTNIFVFQMAQFYSPPPIVSIKESQEKWEDQMKQATSLQNDIENDLLVSEKEPLFGGGGTSETRL